MPRHQALTVNVYVPAAVGVPLRSAEVACPRPANASLSPGGGDPADTYMSPTGVWFCETEIVTLYGWPVWAPGSSVGENTSGGRAGVHAMSSAASASAFTGITDLSCFMNVDYVGTHVTFASSVL